MRTELLSSPSLPPRARTRALVVGVTAVALAVTGTWAGNEPAAVDTTAGDTAVIDTATIEPVAVNKKIAPSGKAAPKGHPKGWRQVFRDDFTGSTLKKPWTKYSGRPGGNPNAYWKPSHVVVEKGMLRLKTYKENGRWVSGGVGTWNGFGTKYGRIDVRFRAPRASGVGYTFLLWPANGGWPPEIDFAEDGGADRQNTAATLHYGATNRQIQRHKKANFRKWNTIGVQWTPGKLVYTLNGKAWATVKHSGVPKQQMVLALQTQTLPCGLSYARCPGKGTPKTSSVDIDWIVAYKKR